MATLIGWGLTNNSLGSRPRVMQEQDVPVITTETCQLKTGFVSFYGNNYSLPVTESICSASDILPEEQVAAIMIQVSMKAESKAKLPSSTPRHL